MTRSPNTIWKLAAGLGVAAAVVLWGWQFLDRSRGGIKEEAVTVLDPAKVISIRTPGGFLEVQSMEKVEEFGWSSRFTCPLVDCEAILKPTISQIKVRAKYVYRIRLAAEWTLRREDGRYLLSVPALQLQEPVAFHTEDMQIQTTEKGWLSPPSGPNREAVVRHLGPELSKRGVTRAYVDAQLPHAEKTVREFARKWMIEQGTNANLPIAVTFEHPNPS